MPEEIDELDGSAGGSKFLEGQGGVPDCVIVSTADDVQIDGRVFDLGPVTQILQCGDGYRSIGIAKESLKWLQRFARFQFGQGLGGRPANVLALILQERAQLRQTSAPPPGEMGPGVGSRDEHAIMAEPSVFRLFPIPKELQEQFCSLARRVKPQVKGGLDSKGGIRVVQGDSVYPLWLMEEGGQIFKESMPANGGTGVDQVVPDMGFQREIRRRHYRGIVEPAQDSPGSQSPLPRLILKSLHQGPRGFPRIA
ncbi:MAG TPA: hypothetical protein VKU80_09345 [Planctomycetota bacterium]|nr:hypothetical protein [Planctomycetota bacterium]